MQSSNSDLLVQDLNSETLQIYLDKDPTFVEYLNSFLLLPAFSNRLFYNKDTGHFEQVHSDGTVCWDSNISPSSSLVTLYLPEDTMGESLDKEQSCQWIAQHRLPLFLRSDLYSEYKISKLLTRPPSPTKSSSSHALISIDTSTIHPPHLSSATPGADTTQTLEDIENLPGTKDRTGAGLAVATSDLDSTKSLGVASSKSHMDLDSRPGTVKKLERRVKFQRSLSVDPGDLTLTGYARDRKIGRFARSRSASVVEKLTSARAMNFLSSKYGMSALWKFLKGTAGERNWLFWLDAERIKYYSKDLDQQRLVRDLRERYLYCGSPLELPPETRVRVKLSKSGQLTMEQIEGLQEAMIERLRDYWCPRFLLHCYKERSSISTSIVKVPKLFHSCSSAPGSFQIGLYENKPTGYAHPIAPLTPTHTPTYMRLGKPRSSVHTQRKFSEETAAKNATEKPIKTSSSTDSQLASKKSDPTVPPATVPPVPDKTADSDTSGDASPVKKPSRKVWGKSTSTITGEKEQADTEASELPDAVAGGTSGDVSRSGSKQALSTAKFSKLAKYAAHHLSYPDSRCASRLEGTESTSGICTSHCHILSVSGTPVHSVTSLTGLQPDSSSKDSADGKVSYESLLHCLAMENRKAGGYFMKYLEELDNGVIINCLQFWREVQEYKTLFVQKKFCPCSVEMKAKGVFGRYISKCCSDSIDCSSDIVDNVSANLWPAYEDLFDQAEEHALDQLYLQWNNLCSSEEDDFQKLETVELPISMESTEFSISDFLDDIDGLSYPSTQGSSHSVGADTYRSDDSFFVPLTDSYLQSCPSDTSQPITLNTILSNPEEFEHFKVFLNDNCAAEDLMCWMDIEAFRGIPAFDKSIRKMKAKQLRKQYFTKDYFFGPNSPATREEQRETVMAGGGNYGAHLPARPRTPVFREAQKHIQARLEKMWLVRFINSPEFMERNKGTRLFRSNSAVKMKSQPAVIEHSFLNSHQAIVFRKFLLNRKSLDTYLRFLKIKAMHEVSSLGIKYPKQDLHFWYEVQKYKGMYHVHTTDATLDAKVTAIVDCFFESAVPPQLQIDVPLSLAELVTRKPGGPYLFRESQAVIFKLLYGGWKEYKTFASGLDARQLKRALDRLERNAREAKRAKKIHEERMKREEEKRRSMLPHFETVEEKERRLKQEKELEEFGKAAVEFSLASPDPSYIYYTALPEDESVLEITHRLSLNSTDSQHMPTSASQLAPTSASQLAPTSAQSVIDKIPKRIKSAKRTSLAKNKVLKPVKASTKKRSGKKHVVEKSQIIKMRLQGKTPDPNPRRIEAKASPTKLRNEDSYSSHDPRQSDVIYRQPSPMFMEPEEQHLRPWGSPSSTPSKLSLKQSSRDLLRKVSSPLKRKQVKEEYPPGPGKMQPFMNTIRMQMSGMSGNSYAYGSGLPENQSHLTITSQTTF